MAATKLRYIRVDETLWRAAMARANLENTNVSELIRQWLHDYADMTVSVDEELAAIIDRLNLLRKRLGLG